jgi:hypothetical protein
LRIIGVIKCNFKLIEAISGVSQGSVLDSILFIIFINETSEIISCQKHFNADTIITSEVYINQLQDDIDNLVEWLRLWLMRLNESKCKVMHVCKEIQHYPYKFNTVRVKQSSY